jgi:hypothetical protein
MDWNGRLLPINYQTDNKVPLYFLLSGDQILMDAFAKESFQQSIQTQISGSYGDFWRNTGNANINYERFGARHVFDSLLPHALKESVIPTVLRTQFHGANFSEFLSMGTSYILFDSFIDEVSRDIIIKGFFEIIGYAPNTINVIDFWDNFRTQHGLSDESFIHVSGSLGSVYLQLIGRNRPFTKKVIEGKGRDPRIDTILDYIADIAIAKGSHLRHSEIKNELVNEGAKVLELLPNGLVMHTIRNNNIGVNPLKLSFHRSEIDGKLNNKQSLNLVQNEFDNFRRSNNAEHLPVYLYGDVINQPVFVDFFKSTYSRVSPQSADFDKVFLENVLKKCISLSANITSTTRVPEYLGGLPVPPLQPASPPMPTVPPVITAPTPVPPVVNRPAPPPTPQAPPVVNKPVPPPVPPTPPPVHKKAVPPSPPPVQKKTVPPPPPPPIQKKTIPLPPLPIERKPVPPPPPPVERKPVPPPPPPVQQKITPPPLPPPSHKKSVPPPPPKKKNRILFQHIIATNPFQ